MAANVNIVVTATDKASGVLRGISGLLGGIATTALAVGTAAAAGFVVLGKHALDATQEWERLGLSMESLVARELRAVDSTLDMSAALQQAGGRTQELLGWIQQLAIQSPFDVQGVATAFRTALAYGFVSDEAQRLTQNMIDFAAATGQPVHVMDQMSLALGQIRAKGRLAGQEILQLVNAGVPVNDILTEMGFTLDDVSKGLVKADDFLAAFSKTMEEDFGGAAKRQTQSWAGLLNSLGDIKKIGLRELFKDTFDVLQPLVAKFADWLQGDGLVMLQQWGEELGNITQKIVDIATAIADAGLGSTEMWEALGLEGFDWGEFVDEMTTMAGNFWVEFTAALKEKADDIDWGEVSKAVIDTLNSIDWKSRTAEFKEGATNLAEALKIAISDALRETDWSGLREAVGNSTIGIIDGMFGVDSKQLLINKIKELGDVIKTGTIDWSKILEGAMKAMSVVMWAMIAPVTIPLAIMIENWDRMMTRLRQLMLQHGQGVMNKFAEGVTSAYQTAADALSKAYNALRAIIAKGIHLAISVSLPNFEALAAQAAAGMAMIAAAMSGGGGSKGTRTPPRPGGSGGNQMATPTQHGGLFRARPGGHLINIAEAGQDEAVIPLRDGAVPVRFDKSMRSEGNIVINLHYSPLFSTADEAELNNRLMPIILKGVREARLSTGLA